MRKCLGAMLVACLTFAGAYAHAQPAQKVKSVINLTLASTGQSFTYSIRDQERPNLEGETYK